MTMPAPIATVTLNSGHLMPRLAYGTGTCWFNAGRGATAEAAASEKRHLVGCVKTALRMGFRHIDEAEMYGTETQAGEAIREYLREAQAEVSRADLFITSKLYDGLYEFASGSGPESSGAIERACRGSMQRLQLDYLDLYLVHSPFLKARVGAVAPVYDIVGCWKEMEKLVGGKGSKSGLCRSIGVSNFRKCDLEPIVDAVKSGECSITPSVNQVEFHPEIPTAGTEELVAYCEENGILISSYSPLAPLVHGSCQAESEGSSGLQLLLQKLCTEYRAADEAAASAARATGGSSAAAVAGFPTPAQVLLRWNMQHGHAVVTTSRNADRIEQAEVLQREACQGDVGAAGEATAEEQQAESLRAAVSSEFKLTTAEVNQIWKVSRKTQRRAYWREYFVLPAGERVLPAALS